MKLRKRERSLPEASNARQSPFMALAKLRAQIRSYPSWNLVGSSAYRTDARPVGAVLRRKCTKIFFFLTILSHH